MFIIRKEKTKKGKLQHIFEEEIIKTEWSMKDLEIIMSDEQRILVLELRLGWSMNENI